MAAHALLLRHLPRPTGHLKGKVGRSVRVGQDMLGWSCFKVLISAVGVVAAIAQGDCPDPTDDFVTESINEASKVAVSFRNKGGQQLTVYWVGGDAEEHEMFKLAGRAEMALSSFEGHAFVVRDAQGEFAGEGRAEKAAESCTAKNGCTFHVSACGDDGTMQGTEVNADGSVVEAPTAGGALPNFKSFRSGPRKSLSDPSVKQQLTAAAEEMTTKLSPTCALNDWLVRETPWRGYHVLCVDPAISQITAFVDGAGDAAVEGAMKTEAKLTAEDVAGHSLTSCYTQKLGTDDTHTLHAPHTCSLLCRARARQGRQGRHHRAAGTLPLFYYCSYPNDCRPSCGRYCLILLL